MNMHINETWKNQTIIHLNYGKTVTGKNREKRK
jgi:hypothetical protein